MAYFSCFFHGLNLINENLLFLCLVYFHKCRASILLGGGGVKQENRRIWQARKKKIVFKLVHHRYAHDLF